MTANPCPACGATLGYYKGPNGVDRCLNCFHDVGVPAAVEAPKPEPNAGGTTVAVASAKPAEQAKDKAVRGPKERTTTSGSSQHPPAKGPRTAEGAPGDAS